MDEEVSIWLHLGLLVDDRWPMPLSHFDLMFVEHCKRHLVSLRRHE